MDEYINQVFFLTVITIINIVLYKQDEINAFEPFKMKI